MSQYNQEFNKDSVVLRYIIVATLAELKNKVYFYNQIDEDTLEKVNVPFIYSITGDERFLQDNFVYDAIDDGKAIGDYEVVPRGMLQLDSLSIDSGSITNKFIDAQFIKEINGQLKTIIASTAFLPLDLTFSVTMICTNNIEMLKVTEAIISKLYKATLFQVDLGMFRVQASMQIPEDFSQEKPFEFSIDDKKEFHVTFNIDVKSFMPVLSGGILISEFNDIITKIINSGGGGTGGGGTINLSSDPRFRINGSGIFEKFDATIADIKISPIPQMNSNTEGSSVNFNEVNPGDIFVQSVTDGIIPPAESPYSEEYRNADNPGYEETQQRNPTE
jgi:hypothetical protein